MKYRCIRGFTVPKFDDDGFETDEELNIKEDSVWELSDSKSRIIGGEIRLDSDEYDWLEISKELFRMCFEPVKEDADHA